MSLTKTGTLISIQDMFSNAHRDFQKGLTTHASFKISDSELCNDLVQDTFMKTWKFIKKGGKVTVMKAFLYHVLNNLIVDEYRKRKTISLDSLVEDGYEPATNEHERLVDTLDGKRSMLHIGSLLEKYQKVIRMRFVEELTLSEMSTRTGQSKNTLSVQIHRGLEQLHTLSICNA